MSMGLSAHGTWSTNGNTTTTSANQVFDFDGIVLNSLTIQAVSSDITIKINDETYTHPVSVGSSIIFDGIRLKKVIVVENNAVVKMSGTHS